MKVSNYRPDIDGLRGISILSVFIYHLDKTLIPGGFLGVDIFFVISGYLISSLIISNLNKDHFSFKDFYLNRARRLFPNLFLMIFLVSLVFSFFLLPFELKQYSTSVFYSLTFISNIFFWSELNYFDSNAFNFPLLHTWSLGIEEQFYLFFPLILFFVFRFQYFFLIILFLFISSILVSEYYSYYGPQGNFYLIVTRAWELIAGYIASHLYGLNNKFIKNRYVSNLSLVVLLVCFFVFDSNFRHPSFLTLIPIICTVLLIVNDDKNSMSNIILNNKFLVFFGLISYSLYLWHYPIISFFHIYFEGFTKIHLFISALTSFILSYLAYRLVELPIRDRKKFENKKLIVILCVFLIPILAINSLALITGGYPDRYKDYQNELINLNVKDRGKFVTKFFDDNKLDDDYSKSVSNKKILLIGDSYAQDFSNILSRVSDLKNIKLATFHISVECGNLYKTNFKHPQKCEYSNNYYSNELVEAIEVSDIIILSSMWTSDVLEHLQQSINNISRISSADLYLVNRKDFGNFSLRNLLRLSEGEVLNFKNKPSDEVLLINKKIKSLQNIFKIDLFNIFCPDNECIIFNEEKKLITHDGGHLTEEGVNYSLNDVDGLLDFLK